MLSRDYRLISLAHVNDPATSSVFPGDPPFQLTTVATIERDGFYLQYVQQGEHTGTHWGAPVHFHANEAAADELDPEDLFLPAIKLDFRAQSAAHADAAVTVADLDAWVARHGPMPQEAAVILWTGWESRWGSPGFAHADAEGGMHHPGFSVAAVEALLARGVLGRRGALGTDTFSPDVGTDATYSVSKLLYREHRISLEVLANLENLPAQGAYVLAGGPIHRRGSGSTATVFAFVPKANR
ncbi:cyclase family protein [Pendulispora rubella]|uniref:Cyclase family protein n=1 Tax=Pendulispora rubella TaxID=2741070 RepID=A0ABZ2KQ77_9BACT